MVVRACDNPNSLRTLQGMGATQILTQGFNDCTNLQDRDSASVKRHALRSWAHAQRIAKQVALEPRGHF